MKNVYLQQNNLNLWKLEQKKRLVSISLPTRV